MAKLARHAVLDLAEHAPGVSGPVKSFIRRQLIGPAVPEISTALL